MESLDSKLPGLRPTIFAEMSALAAENRALNLSQGFPDFSSDPLLFDLVHKHMKAGRNQYAPMQGVPELQEAILNKIQITYGPDLRKELEVCVTAGATEGIFSALQAVVRPGDEVIYFEPAYDAYVPGVKLCGGIPIPIPMKYPYFNIDWENVEQNISSRTRMIIINNPGNPSGKVLTAADLEELERITCKFKLLVLSDEVYEHLVFEGKDHQSVLLFPNLRQRAIAVYSFGKTLHNTGWKTGYILAPPFLMKEFLKVHQFNVFSVNTPVQYAIAEFIQDSGTYQELGRFYSAKRDTFISMLEESRFDFEPASGTYFQLLNYSRISDANEYEFAKNLTRVQKIASIPLSVFYSQPMEQRVLRFCFAKQDETLEKAAEILCRI